MLGDKDQQHPVWPHGTRDGPSRRGLPVRAWPCSTDAGWWLRRVPVLGSAGESRASGKPSTLDDTVTAIYPSTLGDRRQYHFGTFKS